MSQLTLEQVEAEPKADLHLHLDGALSRKSLWERAQDHNIVIPQLPEQTLAALEKVYPNPGPFDPSSEEFDRFLHLFVRSLAVMQTPESIKDSTLDVIRDLKQQNIIYAELRFAPNYHIAEGHSMDEIVQGVLDGMTEGEEETGVKTRLILAIPREINTNSAEAGYTGPTATDIVETALRFQDNGVVAIDLVCNEFEHPPEGYIDAYQMTFGSKLMRTVHAGESAESGDKLRENIMTALREMRADGLGHALPLASMPEALDMVLERGTRIERNPISNKCMSLDNGDFDQLDELIEKGVLVSVNSDDPGAFGPTCSLSQNLLQVANRYGAGLGGIRHLTSNAIKTAFLPEEEKRRLMKTFEGMKGR